MNAFWGDAPTWITTLAVGFGAAQLYQDRQARKQQAEVEARTQASGLSAWAGSFRAVESRDNEYGFVLANDSGLPVRDLSAEIVLHNKTQLPVEVLVLPPGRYFVQLNASGAWDYPLSLEEYGKPVRPYTRTTKYRVVTIRFRDAAGQPWLLSETGALEKTRDATGGDR